MPAELLAVVDDLESLEHWGVISDGSYLAEYQTHQPDPSHWIAVGLVTAADLTAGPRRFPRMLIGAGRSEEAAIHDLEARLILEKFGIAA